MYYFNLIHCLKADSCTYDKCDQRSCSLMYIICIFHEGMMLGSPLVYLDIWLISIERRLLEITNTDLPADR